MTHRQIENAAKRAVKILLSAQYGNEFPCQKYDSCFENGNGKEVVISVIQELEKNGIRRFEELPSRAMDFVGKDWWNYAKADGRESKVNP